MNDFPDIEILDEQIIFFRVKILDAEITIDYTGRVVRSNKAIELYENPEKYGLVPGNEKLKKIVDAFKEKRENKQKIYDRINERLWDLHNWSAWHFNREGKPIDLFAWAKLIGNAEYKRVCETTLPDGKWVSTVWLGTNHRFIGGGPPLIFETMVFKSYDEMVELDTRRYSTEQEAIEGHRELVEEWLYKTPA